MKSALRRSTVALLAVMCLTLVLANTTPAQEIDSLPNISVPSMQFQLFGGLGLFCVLDCAPNGFVRLGLDGFWSSTP